MEGSGSLMIWNCHTTTWGCQMPDFLLHVKEKCKKEKKKLLLFKSLFVYVSVTCS